MTAATPPDPSAQEVPVEDLFLQYKAEGDEETKRDIKAQLVGRHQPLVRYLAETMAAKLPRSVDVDDLMQEGTFGLMDAIEKFDTSRGIKFKTYCSTRVRGAMLDSLRSNDWVPRLARQRGAQLEKATNALEEKLGRAPSDEELANEMELQVKDVRRAEPRAMHSLSDRRQPAGEGDGHQMEGLAQAVGGDPVDSTHRQDLVEVLTRSLTVKEKSILHMYYLEGLTLREIGDRLSITESRVCQIHSNVIKRLRQRLQDDREQYEA